ncbi:MAG: type VI secretion system baseplate subunit TssF [Deltaproteobacteria bacterium]|nr:type VI secretion system baseplate subunit TssF [Deltaproteobacteria bacterium]
MKLDDKLHKAFLEEMHNLEQFRMSYAVDHPSAPLDRDDPDVRRLVEALAFFAARTRSAALNSVERTHRRLFQQFVPYLLSPVPALAMIQARPTGQFAEPIMLAAGTEFALSGEGSEAAIFRSLYDFRVLPLTLGRVEMVMLPAGGFRLLLPFEGSFPRSDEIGTLHILIDHLSDFLASLTVHYQLRRCLRAASVVFGDKADENSTGNRCVFSLGAVGEQPERLFTHPLELERQFFHFPRLELFLNIDIPQPPRNWQKFTLCLDLDDTWPRNLRPSRDVFQLFCVPVVNLQTGYASPQIYDGTQERLALRHPEGRRHFSLHSLNGVYEVQEGQMTPLRPATLGGGSGSFELEETEEEGPSLLLHLPGAFEMPRTIAIDALWIQPWFSAHVEEKLTLQPYRRATAGLRWNLLGGVIPHLESQFGGEIDAFLQLLVLRNKPVLDLDDIRVLLQTLASPWAGIFQPVRDLLQGLVVDEVPAKAGDSLGVLKQIYRLQFAADDENVRPLLELFADHLARVLDIWVADAAIEVRIDEASS